MIPEKVEVEIVGWARSYGHRIELQMVIQTIRPSMPGVVVYDVPCRDCCGRIVVHASRRKIIEGDVEGMAQARPHKTLTYDDVRRDWWKFCTRWDALK